MLCMALLAIAQLVAPLIASPAITQGGTRARVSGVSGISGVSGVVWRIRRCVTLYGIVWHVIVSVWRVCGACASSHQRHGSMHVAPLAIAPPRVAPLLAEGREEEQLVTPLVATPAITQGGTRARVSGVSGVCGVCGVRGVV